MGCVGSRRLGLSQSREGFKLALALGDLGLQEADLSLDGFGLVASHGGRGGCKFWGGLGRSIRGDGALVRNAVFAATLAGGGDGGARASGHDGGDAAHGS